MPNPKPLLTPIWLEFQSSDTAALKCEERYLDAGHIGEVEAKDKVFKTGRGHETQVEDHVP